MDLKKEMGMTPEEYFNNCDKNTILSIAYSDGGRESYINGKGSITACCAKVYKKMSREQFIELLRKAPGTLAESWVSGLSKKEIDEINSVDTQKEKPVKVSKPKKTSKPDEIIYSSSSLGEPVSRKRKRKGD